MGAFFIALLFAIGASTWIYVKMQQKTGYGNNQTALVGAAVSGLLLFIVVFMTAKMFGM